MQPPDLPSASIISAPLELAAIGAPRLRSLFRHAREISDSESPVSSASARESAGYGTPCTCRSTASAVVRGFSVADSNVRFERLYAHERVIKTGGAGFR